MQKASDLNLEHVVRSATLAPESAESLTPGLFLLHGRGADEKDLMGLADAIDPRLTIISARAPHRLGFGYTWYDMPQVGYPDNDTIRESLAQLDKFITSAVESYNLDPQRIYLMGFSQGGIMSAALALLYPGRFRGVIMHSSYVPTNADIPLQPEAVRGLPFFVAHGRYDGVIPIGLGKEGVDYLREAGADVTYIEYPIAHNISEESLYEFTEWLSNQLDAST